MRVFLADIMGCAARQHQVTYETELAQALAVHFGFDIAHDSGFWRAEVAFLQGISKLKGQMNSV